MAPAPGREPTSRRPWRACGAAASCWLSCHASTHTPTTSPACSLLCSVRQPALGARQAQPQAPLMTLHPPSAGTTRRRGKHPTQGRESLAARTAMSMRRGRQAEQRVLWCIRVSPVRRESCSKGRCVGVTCSSGSENLTPYLTPTPAQRHLRLITSLSNTPALQRRRRHAAAQGVLVTPRRQICFPSAASPGEREAAGGGGRSVGWGGRRRGKREGRLHHESQDQGRERSEGGRLLQGGGKGSEGAAEEALGTPPPPPLPQHTYTSVKSNILAPFSFLSCSSSPRSLHVHVWHPRGVTSGARRD